MVRYIVLTDTVETGHATFVNRYAAVIGSAVSDSEALHMMLTHFAPDNYSVTFGTAKPRQSSKSTLHTLGVIEFVGHGNFEFKGEGTYWGVAPAYAATSY